MREARRMISHGDDGVVMTITPQLKRLFAHASTRAVIEQEVEMQQRGDGEFKFDLQLLLDAFELCRSNLLGRTFAFRECTSELYKSAPGIAIETCTCTTSGSASTRAAYPSIAAGDRPKHRAEMAIQRGQRSRRRARRAG